jgi:proline racemase
MRWSRTIQTVDVHCEGEIGRVITGGVLNIPGATMADKLLHLNTVDDSLRRWLCSEPRSGPAGSFCLLTPACDPAADVGLIVLPPDQAHAMSGSNAMCATTALLETGMILRHGGRAGQGDGALRERQGDAGDAGHAAGLCPEPRWRDRDRRMGAGPL